MKLSHDDRVSALCSEFALPMTHDWTEADTKAAMGCGESGIAAAFSQACLHAMASPEFFAVDIAEILLREKLRQMLLWALDPGRAR